MDFNDNLKGKKLGVISLGCDKNRVDTEKMLGVLEGKIQLVSNIEEANIVVINSCAFLEASRKESLDNVFDVNLKRDNNLEKIILTGCLPQEFIKDIFEELTEVDAFLGISDYQMLPDVISRIYNGERVNCVGKIKKEETSKRVLTTPSSYAYLKIADGCDNFCTYCLIPKIRGRYRSNKMQEVISEAIALGQTKELILVAQDVTSYGRDFKDGTTLVTLIKELSKLENIEKIRLLYCYGDKITDELIEEIATNDKVVKYIDIPFQHASTDVLKRMNRRSSREANAKLIEKLKREIDGVAIRTTFIAGFPNESQSEFEEVVSFLKESKFFNAGFFAYSREEGTPAFKMENQIDEQIKEERVEELYAVQAEISKENLKQFIGKKLQVVVENYDEENFLYVARAYFQAPDIDGVVYIMAQKPLQMFQTVEVLITSYDEYDLYGEIK